MLIPLENTLLSSELNFIRQPSKTWGIDTEKKCIKNNTIDGIEALQQAIFLRLNTEANAHDIYSDIYGLPLSDLIGQPPPLVYVNIKNAITDTLLQDDRITNVNGFIFTKFKDSIHVQFNVMADGEIISEEMTI